MAKEHSLELNQQQKTKEDKFSLGDRIKKVCFLYAQCLFTAY
jgi:hypothetical protein